MYFLFLIIFIIAQPIYGVIPTVKFNALRDFLYKTDLDTASPDIYKQYMDYAQEIEKNGSPEQRDILEAILSGDYEEEIKTIEPKKLSVPEQLSKIKEVLTSDVVTPEIWQETINNLKTIDATGTSSEQKMLGSFITQYKNRIIYHMNNVIQSILYDTTTQKNIRDALQFIVIGTLLGALPSVGIASLKVLSGNLPLAKAGQGLIDVGVLSALDSIVRLGLQNKSEYFVGPFAAGLSTAVQDFIGFAGPRPQNLNLFGVTIKTTELAALQATALALAKDTLTQSKGTANIIKNLNFKDIAIGSSEIIPTEQQVGLTSYLQNSLTLALKNQTVRDATATVLSYAVEGAMLALMINAAGFGFYEESATAAISTGMIRGALEGLYTYSTRQTKPAGILQRINSGAGVLSIQNYLTKGSFGTGTLDIVPLVTQQVIAGAMNGVVQQVGGWKNLINTIFSK